MVFQKKVEINGHAAAIYAVDGENNFVYTASGDGFVARWDLTLGKQDAFAVKADKSVYCLKLVNSNSQLVFGLSDGALHVIDLENKQELKHFVQHTTALFSIVENPYKKHIYTTDADGNMAVWNAENWKLLLFLPLHVGKIRDILVGIDGKLLFLACQDGTIRIFETNNYNEIQSFHAHEGGTNCLCLHSMKTHLLVSSGKDGHLRVWNWKSETCHLEIPAHNYGIYRIITLDQGNLFATCSRDHSIKIWDAFQFNVLQKIERKHGGHSHAVNDLWKKSESEFVSVGDDKRIIAWSTSENTND